MFCDFLFINRNHAGEILADLLTPYIDQNPSLFIIPNGGVPVALPIIRRIMELNSQVDYHLLPVKKIHIPHQSAGFGAITIDNEVLLNGPLIKRMEIHAEDVKRLVELTSEEIQRRKREYKIPKQVFKLKGKIAIIIDDGLPTGITMMAAIKSLRKFSPLELIAAVPTASQIAIDNISPYIDKILCPNIRNTFFFSTEQSYDFYEDLNMEDTKNLLKRFP